MKTIGAILFWAIVLPVAWAIMHWRELAFVALGAPYGVIIWWLFR